MRINPAPFIPFLYYFYRGLCGSLRFNEHGREYVDALDSAKEPMVFCLWHDELFPLMRMQKQLDIVTLVSPSRDGEWLALLLERLGLRTVRGSSTRGGVKALLHAARLMKNPENTHPIHACITIDGPMGPRHEVKDGAFLLAQKAHAAIVPVRLSIRPSFKVPSWDAFQVPCPFARVDVYYGKPWTIEGEDLSPPVLEVCHTRLAQELELLPSSYPEHLAPVNLLNTPSEVTPPLQSDHTATPEAFPLLQPDHATTLNESDVHRG